MRAGELKTLCLICTHCRQLLTHLAKHITGFFFLHPHRTNTRSNTRPIPHSSTLDVGSWTPHSSTLDLGSCSSFLHLRCKKLNSSFLHLRSRKFWIQNAYIMIAHNFISTWKLELEFYFTQSVTPHSSSTCEWVWRARVTAAYSTYNSLLLSRW